MKCYGYNYKKVSDGRSFDRLEESASDFSYLKQNEMVQEFAAIKENDELYRLIVNTKPIMKLVVDVSYKIVNEEDLETNGGMKYD